MTPRRYQSGEVDINGRISKCGDRLTRKLLFEAANAMLSHTSKPLALKQWGKRDCAEVWLLESPHRSGAQAFGDPASDRGSTLRGEGHVYGLKPSKLLPRQGAATAISGLSS